MHIILQTSQLSLFWCETQAFGPNLTLSLQTPQISLFLVSSLTLLTLAILTSPGIVHKLAMHLLNLHACCMFIVNLTARFHKQNLAAMQHCLPNNDVFLYQWGILQF